jgi:hypothetical protein
MASDPKNFVKSTTEGIKKIKEENYAYLLESTTNVRFYTFISLIFSNSESLRKELAREILDRISKT